MRTKRFFYNSVSTAVMQIVAMAVGLITPRIMLLTYGSEVNGLVSSVTQFISYFNLIEAGLSGAAIYALYKPLADKDIYGINSILSASKKFYFQSGYIFSALVFILALAYPFYITLNDMRPVEVGILVLILGANGVLEFFSLAKYRVLLTADQRTYVISIATIIQWIVYTVVIMVCCADGMSVVYVRLLALSAIFLRSAILMIYCKRKYTFLNYREKPNASALNKRWDALYSQILGAIHTGGPTLILTAISKDMALVSVYAVYNMVLGGISNIIGIFNSGLAASFGDVIAKGELDTLKKAYREFEVLFYSIIGVIYAIAFVMIIPFVRVYTRGVSDTEYVLPTVGFLFVLNGLLYHLKTPQGMMVISAGLYKETRWQVTIQGAIAIVLGVALCIPFGISGVLLGSMLSNLYRTIDLAVFIPRKVTGTRISATLKQYVVIALEIVVTVIVSQFLFNFSNIDSYLTWAIGALKVGLVAGAAALCFGLLFNRKDWIELWKRLKALVAI